MSRKRFQIKSFPHGVLSYLCAAMEEKELKIIEGATRVFMQYGIKSVNMDDMARHLGISKKTLYLFVNDKEELVKRTMDHFFASEDKAIEMLSKKKLSAIDEALEIMKWVLDLLRNLHPSITYDLEKYHPEIFHALKNGRTKTIYECMVSNMIKGQKEGLYRKDFNPHIIVRIYMEHINLLLDTALFPANQWKLSDVYRESFIYHIRGIASQKGLDYLREKSKQLK